jgi:sugar lactone lactonase YvrE
LKAGTVVTVVCSVVTGSVLANASPSSAKGSGSASDVMTTVAGGGLTTALVNGSSSASVSLGFPVAAVTDAHGNVVIADQNNNVIRVAAASTGTFYGQAMSAGHIYTVVGDGNLNGGDGPWGTTRPPTQVELNDPNGVAVDGQGDIVITDTGNNAVRLLAGVGGSRYGVSMVAGRMYTIAGEGGSVVDGEQASSAGLSSPDGIAFDAHGNVVIADTGDDDVRFLPQASGTYFGEAMDSGYIYIVAGNTNFGYTGDGGPAAAAELAMDTFDGVAIDPSGDVVFADDDNNVVRLVAVANGVYAGRAITAGDIYTIAGNGIPGFKGNKKAATLAELNMPQGVAIDAAGNLFISDSNNNQVRIVAPRAESYGGRALKAGDIYALAGNGNFGYSGDGGPATAGELNTPAGVSVAPSGNVLIADNGNDVVRGVTLPPPSVAAVKPTLGPTSGDRKVTITGASLSGTTSVLFGSRPATSFIVKSAKRIVAYSPATTSVGPVAIVVISPAGPAVVSGADSYTYVVAAPRRHPL